MLTALLLLAMTPAQARHAVKVAPPPVRALLVRQAGCNHFAGEEPYDKERAAYIDAQVRKLRCRSVEADARALKRRYAGNSSVRRLLAEAEHWDTLP
ncbi:hypothetical protein [Novosphingobium olei]|uniref:Uncharacterized protein n=1 Tax=Novosphingobium olei TaxID=2728851 RepID=A0A7Y0GA35_9SPHN|nr:hypothetical protein [Novosphingobium olei]NML94836.1 hypothetical protein [Novosphingobium olei]BEV00320.1 hypothetical protein NSDW_14140 [Novosphingobium olei]